MERLQARGKVTLPAGWGDPDPSTNPRELPPEFGGSGESGAIEAVVDSLRESLRASRLGLDGQT